MELASELAAETYDSSGDNGFAETIDFDDEMLTKSAEWAMNTGDAYTGLSLLSGSTERRVWSAARDTLISNADREQGARFGRQYNGDGKCDFCPMLESRGAVYGSAESAGEGTDFHDNCHCTIYVERP